MIQRGMDQTVVGQKHLIDSLLVALLSNGHVLLRVCPGLQQNFGYKELSTQVIDAKYSRITVYPDDFCRPTLQVRCLWRESEQFQVKGPVFANFVLADGDKPCSRKKCRVRFLRPCRNVR